jgi:hypothetical protein
MIFYTRWSFNFWKSSWSSRSCCYGVVRQVQFQYFILLSLQTICDCYLFFLLFIMILPFLEKYLLQVFIHLSCYLSSLRWVGLFLFTFYCFNHFVRVAIVVLFHWDNIADLHTLWNSWSRKNNRGLYFGNMPLVVITVWIWKNKISFLFGFALKNSEWVYFNLYFIVLISLLDLLLLFYSTDIHCWSTFSFGLSLFTCSRFSLIFFFYFFFLLFVLYSEN